MPNLYSKIFCKITNLQNKEKAIANKLPFFKTPVHN